VIPAPEPLWLPFTQMENFDFSGRMFVRGDGAYLIDAHGRRLFDAVSSVWTTIHGHCHPAIVRAIAHQAAQLDHATLLGAAHPLALDLARRLAALLHMDYAFFSSDGASAIEAALKMTLHYWQNCGQPQRTRFIHLVHSYHGDTGGAMSVSDVAAFKSRYAALTFQSYPYRDNAEFLSRDDIAAVIVEPIVQAAAGMRIISPSHYAALRSMEPLLIVDEIATGFGRTGTMFAYEQLDLQPDIVCLGKGITGGALPLSATIVRSRIYDSFRGSYRDMKHFLHGHSYAGNPIACAAALASLNLFQQERTLEHAALLVSALVSPLAKLASHRLVRDVRYAGLMIGIELVPEGIPAHDAPSAAWQIARDLYERGHFTRPIGNVIQLVPPLSSTVEDVRRFIDDLEKALEHAALRRT
jgi:adenosylmethionine---8-amino-7-oxononanoate aminotransferase